MPNFTTTLATSPVPLFRPRDAVGAHLRMSNDSDLARVRPGVYASQTAWRLLQPWERYLARVHAFNQGRTRSYQFNDVVVHTSRDGRMIESYGALFATDVAHTTIDLVRALPPAFGLAKVDHALQTCTPEALGSLAATQSSKRGIRKLRGVVSFADARSESVGESISRAVIHWLGHAAPELQVELRADGLTDRVDFA